MSFLAPLMIIVMMFNVMLVMMRLLTTMLPSARIDEQPVRGIYGEIEGYLIKYEIDGGFYSKTYFLIKCTEGQIQVDGEIVDTGHATMRVHGRHGEGEVYVTYSMSTPSVRVAWVAEAGVCLDDECKTRMPLASKQYTLEVPEFVRPYLPPYWYPEIILPT